MSSMQLQRELDLMLNQIEERIKPTPDQITRFEMDVLSLVESRLPPLGRDGLMLCRQFVAGEVSESAVQAALESYWKYADEQWPGGAMPTPEACGLRCVIVVLRGLMDRDEDDFVNLVSFFLNLINTVEPHYVEEAQLLERHFGMR